MKTFQRLVKKGDTIVNIGAHVGMEAIALSRQIGSTGRLIFLEPYSFTRRLLKKNVCLNSLNSITTIYGVAASNIQSKGKMFVNYENTGASFLLT